MRGSHGAASAAPLPRSRQSPPRPSTPQPLPPLVASSASLHVVHLTHPPVPLMHGLLRRLLPPSSNRLLLRLRRCRWLGQSHRPRPPHGLRRRRRPLATHLSSTRQIRPRIRPRIRHPSCRQSHPRMIVIQSLASWPPRCHPLPHQSCSPTRPPATLASSHPCSPPSSSQRFRWQQAWWQRVDLH